MKDWLWIIFVMRVPAREIRRLIEQEIEWREEQRAAYQARKKSFL